MGRLSKFVAIWLPISTLSACAGMGSPTMAIRSGPMNAFFLGLWHGLSLPITATIDGLHAVWPRFVTVEWVMYIGRDAGFYYNCGFFFGLLLAVVAIVGLIRML
jgi:hypothetical protein